MATMRHISPSRHKKKERKTEIYAQNMEANRGTNVSKQKCHRYTKNTDRVININRVK